MLNKHDKEMLKLNWDIMKAKSISENCAFTLDISSSCWARFGTVGMSVFKVSKNGKETKVKTINFWKDKTFEEFLLEFNKTEWEIN